MKKFANAFPVLLASLIWGTAFVAQREGAAHLDAYTFTAIRSILGSLVLLPVAWIFCRSEFIATFTSFIGIRRLAAGGCACGFVLALSTLFQQLGLEETTAGKAGFITTLYILFVPILGLCLGHRQPLSLWLAIIIAIVGLFLLCVKDNFTITRGDLMVMRCALTFSAHILLIDFFAKRIDPILLSMAQFAFCGVISLLPHVFGFVPIPAIEAIASCKWQLLYMSVFSTGIAYTLQTVGQKRIDAGIAALLMSLEAVFAALSGWLILHESLTAKEFAGCALVFTATIVAQLRK